MNTLPGAETLAGLIQLCIDQKQGDKEFALFYAGVSCWRAEIGNPLQCVSLGEAVGEYREYGCAPEEAVQRLLDVVQKGQANASG